MLQSSLALSQFADKGRVKFTAPASSSFCLGLLPHLNLPAKFLILLVPFSFNIFLSRLNLEAEELFNYLGFPAPTPTPTTNTHPKAKLTVPLPIFYTLHNSQKHQPVMFRQFEN